MNIRCRNGQTEHRHASVAEVKACYAGPKLAVDLDDSAFTAAIQAREAAQDGAAAMAKMDREIAAITAPVITKPKPVTEAGMYAKRVKQANGEVITSIYKVQVAVHGSGHLYAKALVIDGPGEKARFVYAKGAIKALTSDMKMTLEQAKEFGALYGTCCVCGKTLTDENSIEAGIGPVCAGKWF